MLNRKLWSKIGEKFQFGKIYLKKDSITQNSQFVRITILSQLLWDIYEFLIFEEKKKAEWKADETGRHHNFDVLALAF